MRLYGHIFQDEAIVAIGRIRKTQMKKVIIAFVALCLVTTGGAYYFYCRRLSEKYTALFSHGCFCFAGYLQLSFLGLDVHKIAGKHQAPAGQHQPIQWFAIDRGTNSRN